MPSLSPGHSSAHAGLCFKRSGVPCPLPRTQCFPGRLVNRSLPGLCNQVPTSYPESPSGQKGSPLGNGPRGPSPGPCSLTCRAAQERGPAAFCGCGLSCSSRSARIVQCLWQARSPFSWRALSCTLGQAWADCVSSVCCSLHNSAKDVQLGNSPFTCCLFWCVACFGVCGGPKTMSCWCYVPTQPVPDT